MTIVNRRNFLRFLGMAPLAAVPASQGTAQPRVEDHEKVLHWTCECGEDVYHKRPTENGETVLVKCSRGHKFAVTWHDTHYSFRRVGGPTPPPVKKDDWPTSKWNAMKWVKAKFQS